MPKLIPAVFPDNDKFYPTLQNCGLCYGKAAKCYIRLGNYEKAIDMLELEYDFFVSQGVLSNNASQPESPILKYCDMTPFAGDMDVKGCLRDISEYDKFYDEKLGEYPRFMSLYEKVRALSN